MTLEELTELVERAETLIPIYENAADWEGREYPALAPSEHRQTAAALRVVVAAVNVLPSLLAEVKALRGALEAIRDVAKADPAPNYTVRKWIEERAAQALHSEKVDG